jgi:Zn-dependent peptidase ImmA (M78 family)/transcriptional regulator with XRE-family HTH domain
MTQTSEKARRKLALVETSATNRQFNPEMLILAREFHGMTIKDLSDRIGVSSGYVSQLESGLKEPSDNIMEQIVSALKFPCQHYYEQGRRESTPTSFYRRRVMISPVVLRRCTARMTEIKRNIEKMLSQVDSIEVRLPFIDPEECEGGAKEVARKMRLHLRVPAGPIRDLTKILEEAGVIIIPFDFGTRKIDACSEWVLGHPVIFVNKFITASRLRHTLSHELGHLVMHKFITDECEEQADPFSAEFNLPESEIKRELIPVNLDRLARLKLKWKSSMAAILYRAEALGVISPRNARYQWMLMRRYRYHESEPHEDMMPVEKPTALRELLEVFINSLKFTKEELIGFLNIFEEFYDEVYSGKPVLKII